MTRKSNLELLRILAMGFIILIHFMSAADTTFLGITGQYGQVFGGMIVGICNIGVSCFCLISGYFGIKFSMKKFLKMEIMMIMLSLLEMVVLYFVFPQEMQGAALLEQLAKSLFPFVSRKYWFYSCYVCIFIFSGFIEKLISALDKKEMKRLVLLLLLVFSVFPTMFYFEIMQDAGKGLVQMFMLYLVGRYIRLYRDVKVDKLNAVVALGALWAVNTISIMNPLTIGSITHSLCRDNSITNISMAVILLYIFKDIDFSSKWVNKFTANMFAVFALENSVVTIGAELLTRSGFSCENAVAGTLILLGIVALIFVVCIVIGGLRELIFGKLEKKITAAGEGVFEKAVRRVRL